MLGHSPALRVDSNAIELGLSRSHLLGPSDLLRQDAGNSLPVLKNSFAVSKHAEVAKRMKQFIVPEQVIGVSWSAEPGLIYNEGLIHHYASGFHPVP